MFFKAKNYLSGKTLLYIMEISLPHFLSFSLSALAARDNGAGSCGHRKSVQSVGYIYIYTHTHTYAHTHTKNICQNLCICHDFFVFIC